MHQYLDLMKQISVEGIIRPDRTGTGTKSLFGKVVRYNLKDGFPAMTTKKLAWKAVVSELLWILEGSGSERRLREILHGDANTEKKTVWTENAEAGYWKHKAKFDGDLGRVYGVQWRDWRGSVYSISTEQMSEKISNLGLTSVENYNEHSTTDQMLCSYIDSATFLTRFMIQKKVDQLSQLIDGIKNTPYSRRHVITAWNPGELDDMALPPCHMFAQFYVADGKLSCLMYQRSMDTFLGAPFNIASYSLLTHMIAQVCELEVAEFIHVTGDSHIYNNHENQIEEQLTREPLLLSQLWLNPAIKDINHFTMDDIKLIGYQSHDAIKAPMAV